MVIDVYDREFHEVFDDWRRADQALDQLTREVRKAHFDEDHDGPFRYCRHAPCRAVADLGSAA